MPEPRHCQRAAAASDGELVALLQPEADNKPPPPNHHGAAGPQGFILWNVNECFEKNGDENDEITEKGKETANHNYSKDTAAWFGVDWSKITAQQLFQWAACSVTAGFNLINNALTITASDDNSKKFDEVKSCPCSKDHSQEAFENDKEGKEVEVLLETVDISGVQHINVVLKVCGYPNEAKETALNQGSALNKAQKPLQDKPTKIINVSADGMCLNAPESLAENANLQGSVKRKSSLTENKQHNLVLVGLAVSADAVAVKFFICEDGNELDSKVHKRIWQVQYQEMMSNRAAKNQITNGIFASSSEINEDGDDCIMADNWLGARGIFDIDLHEDPLAHDADTLSELVQMKTADSTMSGFEYTNSISMTTIVAKANEPATGWRQEHWYDTPFSMDNPKVEDSARALTPKALQVQCSKSEWRPQRGARPASVCSNESWKSWTSNATRCFKMQFFCCKQLPEEE